MSSLGRYLLLFFYTTTEVGLLAFATKFSQLLGVVNSIFFMAWQQSAISEYNAADKNEYASDIFNKYLTMQVSASALLLPVIKFLTFTIMGESYREAWQFIPLFFVGIILSGCANFVSMGFYGAKKTNTVFVSSFVSIAVYFAIGYFGAKYWYIWGVGLAYALSQLIYFLIMQIRVKPYLHAKIYFKKLLGPLLAAVLSVVLYYAVDSLAVLVGVTILLGGVFLYFNRQLCKKLLNAVLNRFLKTEIGEIRIFSRDEKKQDDMRHEFQQKYPEVADKLRFYIGDVRDLQSVKNAMHGVDYIFHAAALKQVPSCEFFPIEAVKTNVFGTDNVLTAAIDEGVKCVICLSTDKAAYPVNAMGTSKAMMEKVVVAKSRTVSPERTKICCTRYGNVLCSRGSVVPLWIDQIRAGNPITITEPKMTRFVMSLEEAVDLVLYAFEHGKSGDILVQKAPACTIEVLAQAVKEIFDPAAEVRVIGIRHGEKMYEALLTNEECANAMDLGDFYRVPADKRDLNYDKYFTTGNKERNSLHEFDSNNTELLNVEQVKQKLLSLSYIQNELENWEK